MCTVIYENIYTKFQTKNQKNKTHRGKNNFCPELLKFKYLNGIFASIMIFLLTLDNIL